MLRLNLCHKTTAKVPRLPGKPFHRKSENGFTLIEMMATVVIAGILTTIAAPNIHTMTMNNRMTTHVNEFVTTMALARSEAIKRGVNIDIVAINSSDTTNEWGDGWRIDIGGSTISKFPALDSSAKLNSDSDTIAFQYQPSGRINTTDTLYLCDNRTGETGRKITIATTGRVSTSEYTCS
jgi:type IV fimbrial biogenesis protein FimT